ncbi:response regulator [Streptomyces sp. SPB074]|uniref:response regulator n=1 Tax=Streptomyces sp. (strain SPB074) TaxID=465543 RepID=UPI00017F21C3|nr:response regulator transcription factor [Streptomyces sp. SPB074]EDY42053.1 two-component system response regulator [Streptomyces sp. SPB074]
MTIRVALVDDQPLIRTALEMVIDGTDDLEVVGHAANGEEAIRLAAGTRPHVMVMDIRMPGMDGIEATRRITERGDGPKVLVLTTFDEDDHVYGALRAGACGFLVKDMALDAILDAVRVVAAGDALIAPTVTRRLISEFAHRAEAEPPTPVPTGLTNREREVLVLVGQGLSNTELAHHMHISTATAKTYVSRLLTKLGARDRVQLVITAYEMKLVGRTGPRPAP